MSEIGLLIAALCAFAFALLARRLGDTILTGPLAFLALGFLLVEAGALSADGAEPALHLLAEATLVLLLFADAAQVDLRALRRDHVWPERMLIFGMPLALLFGTLLAFVLLPSWTIWEVALLAAILAPTDAALGMAVVANPAVPDRVRRTLTVESGLNDGLALPAVLFFGCLAVGGVHDNVQTSWIVFTAQQIGLGGLVGAAVGAAGAWALNEAHRRDWTSEAFEGVAVLALAALSYLAAHEVGGNGFVAAFAGGLAFGHRLKGACGFVHEFMESEGQLLILGSFLLIGAALLPGALHAADLATIVLILGSLFLVRPLAIWLSLYGTDAAPLTKGFLGWFGPRGLATALFALLVLGEFDALTRGHELLDIAVLAVAISALLHGVTAAPGAKWYARRIEQMGPMPEKQPIFGAARRLKSLRSFWPSKRRAD